MNKKSTPLVGLQIKLLLKNSVLDTGRFAIATFQELDLDGKVLVFIGQFDFFDIGPNQGQCPEHEQDGNRNDHPEIFRGKMESALDKPTSSVKHVFFRRPSTSR